MKKMLFIIEAPGKIEHFYKSVCTAFGHTSAEVWATGGLIAEMSDSGALDPSTLKITKETLNAQGENFVQRILKNRLKNKELPFHRIFICTDPDREGEHIAWQIYRILYQYTENNYISRGYTLDISPDGLKNMIVTQSLQEGILMSRMARRVIDRLIPELVSFELGLPTWEGVGRVQIGGLEVAKRLERRWKPLQIKGYWKHQDGKMFYVEEYSDDPVKKDQWLSLVRKTHNDVESIVTTQRKMIPPPAPHTYLTLVRRFEDIPSLELSKAIQESYMAGRIGYPRTNRLSWTPRIQDQVAVLSDQLHLSNFMRNDWRDPLPDLSQNDWNIAGHPALHPTQLTQTLPPDGYSSLALKIEREVLARSCATLMKPCRIDEHELTLHYSTPNGDIDSLILRNWEILDHGWLNAYKRSGVEYPYKEIPPDNLVRQKIYYSEHVPMSQAFTQDMHNYQVGQPHNVMTLMSNLQRRELMSNYAVLTHKGLALHETIQKRFPKLLNVDFAERFERTLNDIADTPQIYTSAIKNLLLDLDIDIMDLLDGQTLHRHDNISSEDEVVLPFTSTGYRYE